MKKYRGLAALCGTAIGSLVVLAGPSLAANAPNGEQIVAEVLPAANFAVGTSLTGGPEGENYGFALTANDIYNDWTTCTRTCTLDFAIFVLGNEDESAKVEFKVLSPSGGTVYTYTWSSKLEDTNWYAAYARGNYSVAGTYMAEVLVNGALKGWAPVVFTKS